MKFANTRNDIALKKILISFLLKLVFFLNKQTTKNKPKSH